MDEPHSLRVSATGASYYYTMDHPGNVVGLIDSAGKLLNEYEYGRWGAVYVVTEGVEQPLRYAAREWDATAGLYQVRARWYDPQRGGSSARTRLGLRAA